MLSERSRTHKTMYSITPVGEMSENVKLQEQRTNERLPRAEDGDMGFAAKGQKKTFKVIKMILVVVVFLYEYS